MPKGYFQKPDTYYRVKPQGIILNGVAYTTRMAAVKALNIDFEELDRRLMEQGWWKSCRYNFVNKH